MAATHFPSPTNKNLTHNGVLFVTNNYSAILDKSKAPSEFHLIQDFLASSSIGFALTEPKAISAKAVMQIWSTATYTPGTSNAQPGLTFSYRNDLYEVTPTTVQRALHLGSPTSFTSFFSEAVLREFFTKIGYNGDMTRMGRLVRTKLRQEWNFFFDSIGKCFMNKSSNFDALTQATQNIGYSLIYGSDVNIASMLIDSIGSRITENRETVYFGSFLHLIFTYLCPNVAFQDDCLLPVFQNTPRSFQEYMLKGKQMFQDDVVYPEQVRQLLRQRLPTVYGLDPRTLIQRPVVATPSGSNPSTKPKHVSKHSKPTSDGSQQQSVVKHTRLAKSVRL
ncbi:hypothetical protein POM88_021896 [Heracleum sosnowskyi]|uniref:Uncharacterized protein n=1 Tax=Heracleum sosnowskyi TaxID=360622 RepID=A0AAD8IFS2_9APIA|nr:hypothetical protein POM88_021896 [Heracleum sosnowskyi]